MPITITILWLCPPDIPKMQSASPQVWILTVVLLLLLLVMWSMSVRRADCGPFALEQGTVQGHVHVIGVWLTERFLKDVVWIGNVEPLTFRYF